MIVTSSDTRRHKSKRYDSDSTVIVGGPTLTAIVLSLLIGVAFGCAFTYVIMSRGAVERDQAILRELQTRHGQVPVQAVEAAPALESITPIEQTTP